MQYKIFCNYCDIGLRPYNKNKCKGCNLWFCDIHIYSRPDEANISITKNAPLFCKDCYKETYK